MKQIQGEKPESKGQNSFASIKKTLIEGIVTLAVVGSLSACKNSNEGKPISASVDASASETSVKRESLVFLEYSGDPEGTLKASVFAYDRAEKTDRSPSDNKLLNITPLQNAHLVFQYFEHGTDTYKSQWIPVPGCEDVVTNLPDTVHKPGAGNKSVLRSYYYAQCDFTPYISNSFTAKVTFVPEASDNIHSSSSEIEYHHP